MLPPQAAFKKDIAYAQISVWLYHAKSFFCTMLCPLFCLSEAGYCCRALPDHHKIGHIQFIYSQGFFCNKFNFVFSSVKAAVLTYFWCYCSAIDALSDIYEGQIDRSHTCWCRSCFLFMKWCTACAMMVKLPVVVPMFIWSCCPHGHSCDLVDGFSIVLQVLSSLLSLWITRTMESVHNN